MTKPEIIIVANALKPYITCHAESLGTGRQCVLCQNRRYEAAAEVLADLRSVTSAASESVESTLTCSSCTHPLDQKAPNGCKMPSNHDVETEVTVEKVLTVPQVPDQHCPKCASHDLFTTCGQCLHSFVVETSDSASSEHDESLLAEYPFKSQILDALRAGGHLGNDPEVAEAWVEARWTDVWACIRDVLEDAGIAASDKASGEDERPQLFKCGVCGEQYIGKPPACARHGRAKPEAVTERSETPGGQR